jgi:hypothetical protein
MTITGTEDTVVDATDAVGPEDTTTMTIMGMVDMADMDVVDTADTDVVDMVDMAVTDVVDMVDTAEAEADTDVVDMAGAWAASTDEEEEEDATTTTTTMITTEDTEDTVAATTPASTRPETDVRCNSTPSTEPEAACTTADTVEEAVTEAMDRLTTTEAVIIKKSSKVDVVRDWFSNERKAMQDVEKQCPEKTDGYL